MSASSRRTRFRRWGREAPTVSSEHFVTQAEAARMLGTGERFGIGHKIASGAIEPAFLSDGTEGVTLASVEAELAWRRDASRAMKLRRLVKNALRSF